MYLPQVTRSIYACTANNSSNHVLYTLQYDQVYVYTYTYVHVHLYTSLCMQRVRVNMRCPSVHEPTGVQASVSV